MGKQRLHLQRKYFPGVHDVLRVQRPLDGAHHVDRRHSSRSYQSDAALCAAVCLSKSMKVLTTGDRKTLALKMTPTGGMFKGRRSFSISRLPLLL